MDMKELFENGCFTPEWADADILQPIAGVNRKNLDELLKELSQIKEHIESLQAKSWYLERLRQFKEHGIPGGA